MLRLVSMLVLLTMLPSVSPSQVHLERLKLRLTEDRPPNNITSPGVVPLDVSVPSLRVTRDKEGVFTVHQTADSGRSASGSGSASCSRLRSAYRKRYRFYESLCDL